MNAHESRMKEGRGEKNESQRCKRQRIPGRLLAPGLPKSADQQCHTSYNEVQAPLRSTDARMAHY
jgi:hypothetical protein